MKAEIKGGTVRLPDFLLVGAGKAGTTSLYYYLRQHPQVFMPAPPYKEPSFFCFANREVPRVQHRPKHIFHFDDYVALFEDAGDRIAGEASVCYLHAYDEAIENIKKYIPSWRDLKIIAILRNPVERLYAHYFANFTADYEEVGFDEALETMSGAIEGYIKINFFYEGINAYMENFPNIRVYLYEDFKKDPTGLLKDLFGFLGVDSSFVPDMSFRYNVGGMPRNRGIYRFLVQPGMLKRFLRLFMPGPMRERLWYWAFSLNTTERKRPEMSRQSREQLIGIFREDVLKLQDLIGRDLSAWLR